MKKIYLLACLLISTSLVFGQKALTTYNDNVVPRKVVDNDTPKAPGATLWSNDFSNPSDWVLGGDGDQGQWVIGTEAALPNSQYYGAIQSTTASNGFAFFEGVQFLLAGQVFPQNAWCEMAEAIDVTDHSTVTFKFEQEYRAFNYDETFVEVSLDGGPWSQTIDVNESVATNTSAEETEVRRNFDVSGATTAKFRFRWYNESDDNSYGAGYAWQVDDVEISTPSDFDLVKGENYFGNSIDPEGNIQEYYMIPLTQASSIEASVVVTNDGSEELTGVTFVATETIHGNYIGTSTPVSIASGASDSLYIANPFTPTEEGNYKIEYSFTMDEEDDVPGNNIFNTSYEFSVGGDVYARDKAGDNPSLLTLTSDVMASNWSFGGTMADYLEYGNIFYVYNTDTLSAIDIQFGSEIEEGGNVYGRIYAINADGSPVPYGNDNETNAYTMGTNDAGKYVSLEFDEPIVLQPGEYLITATSQEPNFSIATSGKNKLGWSAMYVNTLQDWAFGMPDIGVVRMKMGSNELAGDCETPMEFSVIYDDVAGIVLVFVDGYPGSTFEIVYGNSGFNPDQEGVTITTDEYVTQIGGLENGEYDFYVRTICEDGTNSVWLGPETVLIDNDNDCETPMEFSIMYDNEAGIVIVFVDGNPENTYEIIYGNSGFNPDQEGITITTDQYATQIEGLADGEYDFYVRTICNQTNSVWVGPETVVIDSNEICEEPMEFFIIYDDQAGIVLVFVDGYPGSTFEIIYGNSGFNPDQEGITISTNEHTTEIGGLVDGEYDFYVRTICNQTNSDWLGPETVLVDNNGTCEGPTDFSVVYDEENEVVTVFIDGDSENTYEITYGNSGFSPAQGGVTITTNESTTEIEGLTYGEYDFYVRAICDGGINSFWLGPETITIESDVDCTEFIVSISGNTEICEGESAVLEAVYDGESTSVLWNNTETTDVITVSEGGNYTVTVVNTDGCEATTSISVTVTSAPSVEGINHEVNSDYSISFSGVGVENATGYFWDFGDGETESNNPNPTHSYANDGNYTVTLTVSNECGETSVSVEIQVITSSLTTEEIGNINVYPNPAVNSISIEYSGNSNIESIVIIDLLGKVVYKRNSINENNTLIDLNNYTMGLYHLNILLQNGSMIQRKFEVIK